jgi:hypothetical protein
MGKSSPILSKIILSETKATKYDILYSLNFKHDEQILNQIVLMLNEGEKTQELIALELLELVLEEQEKKWILPIFREEQPENILIKLELEFPQVLLGKEKRLVSILGNNFIDIPSIIKSLALIELIKSFDDPVYQQLVNTFSKNGRELVQFSANQLSQRKTLSDKTGLLNYPEHYEDLISTDIEFYQKSEKITTLQSFYWINDSNDKKNPKNLISLVYWTLYKEVFPLERLN